MSASGMDDHRKVKHPGRFMEITDDEPDSRTRLLRSQLRRQKVLEQLKLERRLERRLERKEEEKRNDDRSPYDVQPTYFFPPIYDTSGMLQKTPRNMKSDMVDLMMTQSCQMFQMMSQRMALSLVIPEDKGQSQTSRTTQKDKLILSLLRDVIKAKSAAAEDSSPPTPLVGPTYYLPVLPRLPAVTSRENQIPKESKIVLEEPASPPTSMTSRWKQRAPVKQDPTPVNRVPSRRNLSDQQRRKALRKFRVAAYCAVFASIMRRKDAKRLMYVLRKPVIEDDVITGVRIKECVQALHKVYLNPERRMLRILTQVYDSNLDLSSVLTDKSTKEQRHKASETLASFIEHIVYEMTFVPHTTGSLGTEKHSNLYHLLQPQQAFPEHYLWGVEKDLLATDFYNRTPENMSPDKEFIILIGLCVGRALVATILRYPHQFGLTHSVKTEALSTKIRLIVTLFIYLIRKLYAPPNGNPVDVVLPEDLDKKLFSDEVMTKIYKKLRTSFDYAEKLLRDWGQNYVRKLRHT